MAQVPSSALITGASTGFGLDVAVALAKLNWRVFASVRDPAGAHHLKAAAESAALGDRIQVLELDVRSSDSIRKAVTGVLTETDGQLSLLLNNAGYTDIGFFEDMSESQCRAIMETNFFGALGVTRAVLPAMRQAGRGRIGFVSSNAVNTPHPTMTLYAASKWALEGFAEGLAMEVAPFGIQVVVIEPGNHRTPFGSKVQMIKTDSSAYAEFWNSLLPGLSKLGGMGADPLAATAAIVQAVAGPDPTFMNQIGIDTQFFAHLKRTSSFEARAAAVRRIVGFPKVLAPVNRLTRAHDR